MPEASEMPVYPTRTCQFLGDGETFINTHPIGTPVSRVVKKKFGEIGLREGATPSTVRCMGNVCGKLLIMHTTREACVTPPGLPEPPEVVAGYEYKKECTRCETPFTPPEEPTGQVPAVLWEAPIV